MSRSSIKHNIVREYIKKFPNTANKTLANLIYKDSPELFSSAESCRSVIRIIRGVNGQRSRKETKDKYEEFYSRVARISGPHLDSVVTHWVDAGGWKNTK